MPEDASLDAFDSRSTDAESADSASEAQQSDGEESVAAADESAATDEPPTADPAVSTFDWSPEGGECADCGESVARRWRADGERGGELVCADCKEW